MQYTCVHYSIFVITKRGVLPLRIMIVTDFSEWHPVFVFLDCCLLRDSDATLDLTALVFSVDYLEAES